MSHESEYLSPSMDEFIEEMISNRVKTLVIHPDDRSTDFLKEIYRGKYWTVVNDHNACKSRKVLTNLIKKHDRIIMLGHGYPGGLFYTAINSDMVYLLREKDCVCIWCNADQFVNAYGLKGFYTGMFISEVGEAYGNGIKASQDEVTYSNNLFATELNKVIDTAFLPELIKEAYDGECPVIRFNNERLYYRDDEDIYLFERNHDFDEEEMRDFYDDLSEDEQPDFGDDFDPAGGHGLNSHI